MFAIPPQTASKVGQITEQSNRPQTQNTLHIVLSPSTPDDSNCCCSNGSVPYWSNPPFLIFDIRMLWRSVLSPNVKKIKNGGLEKYTKV